MFDARSILDQLTGSGMMKNNRLDHAVGPNGVRRSGGGLGDLLGGILGGAGSGSGGSGSGGAGGALGGLAGKAQDMLGQGANAVRRNDPVAVGGLGALAGAVLGGRGGMLGGGVLAVLGSLAYAALNKQSAATATPEDVQRDAPLGLREPQTKAEQERLQDNALLVLRAMINATKADGTVDAEEVRKISEHLRQSGTNGEAQQFVMSEMAKPMDTDGIVAAVDSKELAVEIYAASLLAIEIDTPAEREYIQGLGQRLGLTPDVLAEVHRNLGVQGMG